MVFGKPIQTIEYNGEGPSYGHLFSLQMPPDNCNFLSSSLLDQVAAPRRHLDQNASAVGRIFAPPHQARPFHVADQPGHRGAPHALERGQFPNVRSTVIGKAGQR